jgi:Arabinose efflux permease
MAGAMLAGPIADRFGRKPVLLFSVALFGLFSLLSAWAPSLQILVALRFFTGIGIGGAMPTTVALTSDYTPDRWRTSVVMFMFTGNTIGGFSPARSRRRSCRAGAGRASSMSAASCHWFCWSC